MTCPGIPNLKNSMMLEEIKRELIEEAKSWRYSNVFAIRILKEYYDIVFDDGNTYLNLYRDDVIQENDEVKPWNGIWYPIDKAYYGKTIDEIDSERKEEYRRPLG